MENSEKYVTLLVDAWENDHTTKTLTTAVTQTREKATSQQKKN
jgi:hypothetical protein